VVVAVGLGVGLTIVAPTVDFVAVDVGVTNVVVVAVG